jgi:hypothetical protein
MLAHPTTTRTLAIPKTEFSKINPETVAYFSTQNTTINSPRITTIPPQFHHQKTTFYHPFSPKPPAKRKTSPKKIHALKFHPLRIL